MTPHIWAPEPIRHPRGGIILPGEHGTERLDYQAGSFRHYPQGVIRRSPDRMFSSSSGPFGSPVHRWLSTAGLWQDLAKTTPAVADGDPVAVWTDTVAGVDITNAAGTTRPLLKLSIINGQPVIRFDGSNDYLTGTYTTINKPYSVFLVGRMVSLGSTKYIYDLDSGNGTLLNSATGNVSMFDGGGFGPRIAAPSSSPIIIFGGWDATTPRLRFNAGTADTTSGIGGLGNSTQLTLAAQQSGPSSFTQIDVAELLIYSGLMSTGDETSERNILNAVYATF